MSEIQKTPLQILKEKADIATAKYQEALAAEQKAEALANVKAGDEVTFIYGRGETRKQHVGTVRVVVDTEKGRKYSVLFGAGIDERIEVIDAAAIVDVPVTGAGADPLASII